MIEDLPNISAKLGDGTFTCMDLVRCMYNLNDTEITILRMLEEGEGVTAGEAARSICRDRSTTYRGLEKLVAAGLVYKERRGGRTRGYTNVYRRIPVVEIYRRTEAELDRCYRRLKEVLGRELAKTHGDP